MGVVVFGFCLMVIASVFGSVLEKMGVMHV